MLAQTHLPAWHLHHRHCMDKHPVVQSHHSRRIHDPARQNRPRSGTTGVRTTGIESKLEVQADNLKRLISARDLVSCAISCTTQDFPSKSSMTSMSHACGGMPSTTTLTMDVMVTWVA